MRPEYKDRLIYIVTGGIFIPLSYSIALILLSSLVSWPEIPALAWLGAPVLWPIYLGRCILPAGPGDFWLAYLLLSLPFANFALYALLTYALIRWWQRMPRLR